MNASEQQGENLTLNKYPFIQACTGKAVMPIYQSYPWWDSHDR